MLLQALTKHLRCKEIIMPRFFNQKSLKAYKLGGPRSFHKFTYKKTQLILIGEAHYDMPKIMVKKYAEIFNQFAAENDHIKLIVEGHKKDDKEEKSSENMTFIECMKNQIHASHLEIIHSDERRLDDGFINFMLYMCRMDEIITHVLDKYNKKYSTNLSQLPFPADRDPDPYFKMVMKMISEFDDKKITFSELFDRLDSSLIKVDQLCDKYSTFDENIGTYLRNCVMKLIDAGEITSQLCDEYHSLEHNKQKEDKEIEKTPLTQACVELMFHQKTFGIFSRFLDIIDAYVLHFLNATLCCELWDELNKDDEKILIVVTGDAHTESLASIFKKLCKTEVSFSQDPKNIIISPEKINNYLINNIEIAPKRRSGCAIL
jgi:hypothetical protein